MQEHGQYMTASAVAASVAAAGNATTMSQTHTSVASDPNSAASLGSARSVSWQPPPEHADTPNYMEYMNRAPRGGAMVIPNMQRYFSTDYQATHNSGTYGQQVDTTYAVGQAANPLVTMGNQNPSRSQNIFAPGASAPYPIVAPTRVLQYPLDPNAIHGMLHPPVFQIDDVLMPPQRHGYGQSTQSPEPSRGGATGRRKTDAVAVSPSQSAMSAGEKRVQRRLIKANLSFQEAASAMLSMTTISNQGATNYDGINSAVSARHHGRYASAAGYPAAVGYPPAATMQQYHRDPNVVHYNPTPQMYHQQGYRPDMFTSPDLGLAMANGGGSFYPSLGRMHRAPMKPNVVEEIRIEKLMKPKVDRESSVAASVLLESFQRTISNKRKRVRNCYIEDCRQAVGENPRIDAQFKSVKMGEEKLFSIRDILSMLLPYHCFYYEDILEGYEPVVTPDYSLKMQNAQTIQDKVEAFNSTIHSTSTLRAHSVNTRACLNLTKVYLTSRVASNPMVDVNGDAASLQHDRDNSKGANAPSKSQFSETSHTRRLSPI